MPKITPAVQALQSVLARVFRGVLYPCWHGCAGWELALFVRPAPSQIPAPGWRSARRPFTFAGARPRPPLPVVNYASFSAVHTWPPLVRASLQLLVLLSLLGLIQRYWPFEHRPADTSPARRHATLLRACLVPALFIGFGLATLQGHGWYSSYQAYHDIQGPLSRFRTSVDNYLQYLPFVELIVFSLLGVEGLTKRLNRLLLIAKAEALLVGMVFSLKYGTNLDRPNGDYYSFPSGHTAEAFLAASIVHQELRHRSPWYGAGAYAIAALVGLLRLLNNKHWEADVWAGAGIGILAVHLAYFFHRRPRRSTKPAHPTRDFQNVMLTKEASRKE